MEEGIKRLEIATKQEGGEERWKHSRSPNYTHEQTHAYANLSGDEGVKQTDVRHDALMITIRKYSWTARQHGKYVQYTASFTQTTEEVTAL